MENLRVGSRGQMRGVEAVVIAIIVVSALAVTGYMLTSPNPLAARLEREVEEYAYDFLLELAHHEVFDKAMFSEGELREDWEHELSVVVSTLIKPGYYFNLSIFNSTPAPSGGVELVYLGCAANVADPEFFENLDYVASSQIVYTTREGWILVVRLVLGRA